MDLGQDNRGTYVLLAYKLETARKNREIAEIGARKRENTRNCDKSCLLHQPPSFPEGNLSSYVPLHRN